MEVRIGGVQVIAGSGPSCPGSEALDDANDRGCLQLNKSSPGATRLLERCVIQTESGQLG